MTTAELKKKNRTQADSLPACLANSGHAVSRREAGVRGVWTSVENGPPAPPYPKALTQRRPR